MAPLTGKTFVNITIRFLHRGRTPDNYDEDHPVILKVRFGRKLLRSMDVQYRNAALLAGAATFDQRVSWRSRPKNRLTAMLARLSLEGRREDHAAHR